MSDKARLETLGARLKQLDVAYYKENTSPVSDAVYDGMRMEYAVLSKRLGHAPYDTGKVGNDITGTWPVKEHLRPMLSLDNVFSELELIEWMDGIQKSTGYTGPYVVELKYDGVSLDATLNPNGRSFTFITRGDGVVGEDVTPAVASLLYNTSWAFPTEEEMISVHGEVVLSRKGYVKLNEQRDDGKKYVSPRNAVSGLIRSTKTKGMTLDEGDIYFMPYSHFTKDALYLNIGQALASVTLDDAVGCIARLEKAMGERDALDFEIDGLVFKVADPAIREELGSNRHHPKWAIAYKFPEQVKATLLIDVAEQLGRTGVITPVAIIGSVVLGGVVVTSATLHNYEDVERLGIRVGDMVRVKRAGDVIPKIISRVDTDNPNGRPIVAPTTCFYCHTPTIKDGAFIRCPNSKTCVPQQRAKLLYQVGRGMLDIKGLGAHAMNEYIYNTVIENGNVVSLSQMLTDIRDGKHQMFTMSDVVFEKITRQLDKALRVPEWKVLALLCIPNVGNTTSEKLYEAGHTITSLIADASEDKIQHMDVAGVGPETLASLQRAFTDDETVKELLQLLKVIKPETPVVSDAPMKLIGVSGSLDMPRHTLTQELAAVGYKLVDISKRCDVFLVGYKPSESKVKKAKAYGIRVLEVKTLVEALALLD